MTARKDFSLGGYGGGATLSYSADFWDTIRAAWADGVKMDYTGWSNIPTGARRFTLPATGELLMYQRNGGGTDDAVFDSRAKVNKAGDVMTGVLSWATEVELASAATVDIGDAAVHSNLVLLTGNATVGSLGTNFKGAFRIRVSGTPKFTHSASLRCPGGRDLQCAAGDMLEAVPKATSGTADGWVLVWLGGGRQPFAAYTPGLAKAYAANVQLYAEEGNVVYIGTLTGAVNLVLNTALDGQTIKVRFKQDGTGGRSVSFSGVGAFCKGFINKQPNAVSWLELTYSATAGYFEGQWTAPAPMAFRASGAPSSTTSQSPAINYGDLVDPQGQFNNGAGTFTAPVTGHYWVSLTVQGNTNAGDAVVGFVRVNGSAPNYLGAACTAALSGNLTTNPYASSSGVLALQAGDTISVFTTVVGGHAASVVNFSGHFLG